MSTSNVSELWFGGSLETFHRFGVRKEKSCLQTLSAPNFGDISSSWIQFGHECLQTSSLIEFGDIDGYFLRIRINKSRIAINTLSILSKTFLWFFESLVFYCLFWKCLSSCNIVSKKQCPPQMFPNSDSGEVWGHFIDLELENKNHVSKL